MRHSPLWLGRYPRKRRPSYDRLKGAHETEVVVVGGGLTGAACALALSSAGIDVVLLESDQLGSGVTAGETGILREGFAGSFHDTVAAYGLRTTRTLWDGLRRASLDFAAALRRYGIRCDLEAKDVLTFAPRASDAARLLKRDSGERHDAGIEGSWVSPAAVGRETALEAGGAIRTHGFVIDPYRACLGLAAAAVSRGARLYERTTVTRIRGDRKHVEASTDNATVRAQHVVVATGAPITDLKSLRRHLEPQHVYGVVTEPIPGAVRRRLGQRSAVLDDIVRDRLLRWTSDDRALLNGGRQPQLPDRSRERALVQRTGQLMYEFLLLYPEISGVQPESSWDPVEYDTVDGLPLLGPHRNFPRHFFAFGSSRHGAGVAWLAARLALRFVQGEPLRNDGVFSFTRL